MGYCMFLHFKIDILPVILRNTGSKEANGLPNASFFFINNYYNKTHAVVY